MIKIYKLILTCGFFISVLGLGGCALPTLADNLDKMIQTTFTNPPRAEKRYVTAKNSNNEVLTIIDPAYYSIRGNWYKFVGNYDDPIYYKKEQEGINIRYYIHWIESGKCSYSLLVSPEDIILSWRNEGPTHVSQCYRS